MIERAQHRPKAHDVMPRNEKLWMHHLAKAGTFTTVDLYASAPPELSRDFMHQRFRSMKNCGKIIPTRCGRWRLMGCV